MVWLFDSEPEWPAWWRKYKTQTILMHRFGRQVTGRVQYGREMESIGSTLKRSHRHARVRRALRAVLLGRSLTSAVQVTSAALLGVSLDRVLSPLEAVPVTALAVSLLGLFWSLYVARSREVHEARQAEKVLDRWVYQQFEQTRTELTETVQEQVYEAAHMVIDELRSDS
jgi:hypothetical protein